MSTLTSAQLHVKRSSTRLHAPPGGVSSISFGCGGLGTAEPAEDLSSKEESSYSRPGSSGQYAPSHTSYSSSNNNAPSGYPNYSTKVDSAPYNNYAPQHQSQQYQQYQQQPNYPNSYNSSSSGNFGNNNFSGRPPSSRSRSSCRSSSSSCSWGSQPPLTSSKRDQNWEKKRRQWLARKNGTSSSYDNNYSASNAGDSEPRPTSTWSQDMQDAGCPASPLSKFMHQHAQQQPPPSPGAEYQRVGTACSSRSGGSNGNSYTATPYQSQPFQSPAPAGYSAANYSRGGLSTASSSSSSSGRRQPPGGRCQWALA